MASVPYDIIASSEPFRFVVGPSKKEFFVHAELIARLSKPLSVMVHGEWKDGKDRLVVWSDVDEGTFARFCEFAYTGNYKAAEPFKEASMPSEVQNGDKGEVPAPEASPGTPLGFLQEIGQPFDPWAGMKNKKKKKTGFAGFEPEVQPPNMTRFNLWSQFGQELSAGSSGGQGAEHNADPLTNYTDVLLSHAHLYTLADCYGISALMELTLRKLHQTLEVFNLHGGARVTDFVQLTEYSYTNTVNKGVKEDKLRTLLAIYAACNIETMWPNHYFQDILESGEISKAIIGQLLRRLG